MKWWKSPQVQTWLTHGMLAIWIPLLFAVLTKTGDKGVIWASWLTLIFFYFREKGNEYQHKADGTWDTPDAGGITPADDKWLDLAGPAVVTFCFTVVFLLS